MGATPAFTPRDIRNDVNRFGGTMFHFIDKSGMPSGPLLSFVSINHPRWDSDARSVEQQIAWHNENLVMTVRDFTTLGGQMRDIANPVKKGEGIEFTPKWGHKGYTMYNSMSPRGQMSTKLAWLSLASHRQYRWGLSPRAFESRICTGFPSPSNRPDTQSTVIANIWHNGAMYVPFTEIDLSIGAALTPSIGLHRLDDAYGVLVHNTRTVIGFYHDGQLSVEHQARPLSHALKEYAHYVPTSTLTSLYKTKILPHTMQSGQRTPPDEMEQPEPPAQLPERLLRQMAASVSDTPSAPLDWARWSTRSSDSSISIPTPEAPPSTTAARRRRRPAVRIRDRE